MIELHGLASVHLLGPKPPRAYPDYIAAFDVCLIPDVVDDYTNNIFPDKLNEYVALGKPVVSANTSPQCGTSTRPSTP
jgi:teichuronic acid biosynthesis glycosyltransferase TuaH